MPTCEMCGKKLENLIDVVVEGTLLRVCQNCASFGNVVKITPKKDIVEEKSFPQEIEFPEKDLLIRDDYAEKIKKARESKNLKQEDLAKAIAEKESIIHKLEAGQISPSLALAKKLEQFLRIKIIKEHEATKGIKKLDFRDSALTVGDLLNIKK